MTEAQYDAAVAAILRYPHCAKLWRDGPAFCASGALSDIAYCMREAIARLWTPTTSET